MLMEDYLAAGLDPKKSTLFIQSQVPESTELAWILFTITPKGELERMTQFKEKGADRALANMGLMNYPVLMAADIILYDAEFVPVGDDQLQHLELTRTLTRKFNSKFGKVFVEPKPLLTKASRIMSLSDPNKKMSKSVPGSSLFLDDLPATIRKKIMSATTDSGKEVKYDEKTKPGITNLIKIYQGFSGKPFAEIEREFAGKNYGEFKSALAEIVIKSLEPFREKSPALLKSAKTAFEKGRERAGAKAKKKMVTIKKSLKLI